MKILLANIEDILNCMPIVDFQPSKKPGGVESHLVPEAASLIAKYDLLLIDKAEEILYHIIAIDP